MTEEVIISRSELRDLGEYSSSLPTGKTIGKRWRATRYVDGKATDWKIAEYVDHPDPTKIGIKWVWAVIEPGLPHMGNLERELPQSPEVPYEGS